MGHTFVQDSPACRRVSCASSVSPVTVSSSMMLKETKAASPLRVNPEETPAAATACSLACEEPVVSASIRNRLSIQNFMLVLGLALVVHRLQWSLSYPSTFAFQEPPGVNPLKYPGADSTPSKSRIPHTIHQSYKSLEELPPAWTDTPSKWKEFHPDYEYKFWSDTDNRMLIATHYPWFLETYDSYPHPIQRADAARYFVVLHYGGIYADLDIMPLRDVTSLLNWVSSDCGTDCHEMIVAETYNLGLTNALFASVANSPVLTEFVHTLPQHTRPFFGFEFLLPHFGVLLSTGPTRFWIYLNGHRDKITTLNPAGWGQCHQCHQGKPGQCTVEPNSYFETTIGGSWHKWDTQFMNFIFCFPQFFTWLVCGALVGVWRWWVPAAWNKKRRGTWLICGKGDNVIFRDKENALPLRCANGDFASSKDFGESSMKFWRTSKRSSAFALQTLFWMLASTQKVESLARNFSNRWEELVYVSILWALYVI